MREDFDLVIRSAEVVTATDRYLADIGVVNGQINAIAKGLSGGRKEIDAKGRLVTPGGIDSH